MLAFKRHLRDYTPGDRNTDHYFARMNTTGYLASLNMTGKVPENTADRLWNMSGSPFVLTIYEDGKRYDYAVKDEDAIRITEDIFSWCEEHEDSAKRPMDVYSPDAPEYITEISIKGFPIPFNDPGLLKKWFDELKEKCGEPLSKAEYDAYLHPAPDLSKEIKVSRLVEQQVPFPRPSGLPTPEPENYRSELIIDGDRAVLSVYSCEMHLEYIVPAALIPKINEETKMILSHPVNGGRAAGQADAWAELCGDPQEHNADPEEVLALFEHLIPECGDPVPCRASHSFYRLYPDTVLKKKAGAWTCPLCKKEGNTGEYCASCGVPKAGMSNGSAGSLPRPRAAAPWHCGECDTDGNSGGYCEKCGKPYPGGADPDAGKRIGYRPGPVQGLGESGGFGLFGSMGTSWFAPPPCSRGMQSEGPEAYEWRCACGIVNSRNFCTECGRPRP
ncbi:MAG: hypothetical protein IKS11_01820 [Lachnospiraceae bacterium]|nr:hypothetical protein [Lachnospiraceae bacterium]